MSIASVVRRGYADSIPSVTRRGYSSPSGGPTLIGGVGTLQLVLNQPASTFDLSAVFTGTGISYAIAPALHADGSFNTSTGVLTWNPLTAGTFGPYTVTASNSSGSTATDAFEVVVQTTAPDYEIYDSGLGFRFRIQQ